MFLNSIHEQCPSSDPKQCTVTKLGWVHSAHTQNPGRARSAHVVGTAARTASLSRACRARSQRRSRMSRALVPTRPGSLPPGRDLTSMSRHQGSQNHVATSNRCRDIEVAKNMSRHQIDVATPTRTLRVATSNFMSRHRLSCPASSQVATPEPGRDLLDNQPMSQHRFHVATSFLPSMRFPGRDAKLQVATSHAATHVATSK